jgi:two-component system OmpR family sensor kinase
MQKYPETLVCSDGTRLEENLHAATLTAAMIDSRRFEEPLDSQYGPVASRTYNAQDQRACPAFEPPDAMIADLRRAVRARDDFVAIAAHELRNAMAPIDGVVDLTLTAARNAEPACPPQVMALLERMQRLVEDFLSRAIKLLDIGRIKTGNLQLTPTAIDLSSLVLLLAYRFEVIAARKGNPLVIEIEQGIFGLWDPLAVAQVVENLLLNAIKFGQRNPITVRLWSDKESVWLEVRDRGMGMRPEQRAGIFGQFEQAVTQHRGYGFGIGLWVANSLVTAMNGRFIVESQLGEGSNFAVELPRPRS